MSFHASLVTFECNGQWPEWFVKEYRNEVRFVDDPFNYSGDIYIPNYRMSNTLHIFRDMHKAVMEWDDARLECIIRYDCGAIEHIEIHGKEITERSACRWDDYGGYGMHSDNCDGCEPGSRHFSYEYTAK